MAGVGIIKAPDHQGTHTEQTGSCVLQQPLGSPPPPGPAPYVTGGGAAGDWLFAEARWLPSRPGGEEEVVVWLRLRQRSLGAVFWELISPTRASAKANGWRRSISRHHSSDLCLVFLLHLESRGRHAVMCAEGGLVRVNVRTPWTVFCFTSHPTPRCLPLFLSRFSSNCFLVWWSASKVDFRAVVDLEKKKRRNTPFSVTWFWFHKRNYFICSECWDLWKGKLCAHTLLSSHCEMEQFKAVLALSQR